MPCKVFPISPAMILTLSFLSQSTPTVSQVWQSAVDQGFSGGAIVVSGNQTLLFEIKNGSTAKSLQLNKQIGLPICSVTKAITSEIVLDLVFEGRLFLNETVRQYLPWAPEYTSQVTVRQLLTHTSGLPNMNDALGSDASGVGNIYRSYDESLKTPQSRLQKILGDRAAAAPGSKYDYNNTDFLALQLIAEAVTHQDFEALLQNRVLSKANMRRTHLAKWDPKDQSFVDCFQKAPSGDKPLDRFNMAVYGGAAGVISTPEDISRWMKFTLNDPIGKRTINSGSQFGGFQGFGGYAFQTGAVSKALSNNAKEQAFERPGAVNAYGLQVSFLPERHLAVAVFSNREDEHLGSIFEGKGLAFDLIVAASRIHAVDTK